VSDHTPADAGFLCDKDAVLGDTLLHMPADHKLITHYTILTGHENKTDFI
jgi:hypothetical protein